MADYKAMYYHLAGRMAATVEVLELTNVVLDSITKSLSSTTQSLEATTKGLNDLKDKLALSQQKAEEMLMGAKDDDEDLE